MLAERKHTMHTIEEAKKWVDEHRDELIQNLREHSEVPDYLKAPGGRFEEVWCSGCWMNEKLRETGATEDEVHNIGFAHGQRSFFGNPYRWAVAYLNEFKQRGNIADHPGAELADKINSEHIQVNGDVMGIAVEDHC